MSIRSIACTAVIVVAASACARNRTIGSPEEPTPERKEAAAEKEAEITKRNVARAGEKEVHDVDVDLTKHGIAARIRAPEHAKVSAVQDGVQIQSGDDYDLRIGRGVLDVLGEKGEIVKTYGSAFDQFLEDDGKTIVWETKAIGGKRFHFFASYRRQQAGYHCRTGPDGAPTIELVRAMIDACRDVNVVDATTLAVKPRTTTKKKG